MTWWMWILGWVVVGCVVAPLVGRLLALSSQGPATPPFSNRPARPETETVLIAHGALVGSKALEFEGMVMHALEGRPARVIIDFAAVTSADHVAASSLLRCARAAAVEDCQLRLRGLPPGLLHLVGSSGLLYRIPNLLIDPELWHERSA